MDRMGHRSCWRLRSTLQGDVAMNSQSTTAGVELRQMWEDARAREEEARRNAALQAAQDAMAARRPPRKHGRHGAAMWVVAGVALCSLGAAGFAAFHILGRKTSWPAQWDPRVA